MQDVQSREDGRGIAIQRVGVKDVRLPFLIKKQAGGYQQVLATITFTVSLPMEFKGTHMSRFLEILLPWSEKPLAEEEMDAMLTEALDRLHAEAAEVRLAFTYFLEKRAPVSGRTSLLDVDASFTGRKRRGMPMEFELGLSMPFTSLCPCSKEISSYGAHNQRSRARVRLRFHAGVPCIYIEDLASLLEQQGSAPIYPLLKRADENTSQRKPTSIRNSSRIFCAIRFLRCGSCRGLRISLSPVRMRSPSTATMPLRHMKSI